ncbi:MAG: hypothetical protein LBT12_07050, partial [Oscillospiraceae bacterium]|nr:hypothetical protein [Oscillospiraceae bacterium]
AVGVAYFLFSRDRITLALSGLILLFSLFRTYTLYAAIAKGKYEMVEGVCVGVSAKLFRKQCTVKIMDDDGVETALRLGKQTRVKIGARYRFYFTEHGADAPTGNAYFDAALSSGRFFGFDEISDGNTGQDNK